MNCLKQIILLILLSGILRIDGASLYISKDDTLNTKLLASDSLNLGGETRLTSSTMSSSTMTSDSFSTLRTETTPKKLQRSKRAIIFRPLFVYRQQQIKKQRLKEMREQQNRQQMAATTTQKPKYASNYPYYYYMG